MLTNNQDEESKAAENLEVAGGICWRQRWRILLCLTGEIIGKQLNISWDIQLLSNEGHLCNWQSQGISWECVFSKNWNISQRLGSCLSPSFLLRWPIQSRPLPSTTVMVDFDLCVCVVHTVHCRTHCVLYDKRWYQNYFNNQSTIIQ